MTACPFIFVVLNMYIIAVTKIVKIKVKRKPRVRKLPPIEPEHYLTHFPKHGNCEICKRFKTQSATCRKKDAHENGSTEGVPTAFGDSMTADTMVSGPRDHSVNGDTCAHVIKDRAINWV